MPTGDKSDLEIWKHGLTDAEIAKILGCTRQNIDAMLKKILKKLRPIAEQHHLRDWLEE